MRWITRGAEVIIWILLWTGCVMAHIGRTQVGAGSPSKERVALPLPGDHPYANLDDREQVAGEDFFNFA